MVSWRAAEAGGRENSLPPKFVVGHEVAKKNLLPRRNSRPFEAAGESRVEASGTCSSDDFTPWGATNSLRAQYGGNTTTEARERHAVLHGHSCRNPVRLGLILPPLVEWRRRRGITIRLGPALSTETFCQVVQRGLQHENRYRSLILSIHHLYACSPMGAWRTCLRFRELLRFCLDVTLSSKAINCMQADSCPCTRTWTDSESG